MEPITSVEVDGRQVNIEYTTLPITGAYQADVDLIVMNRKLLEDPELHEYVLEHEKRHALARHKVFKNIMIDATESWGHITNEDFVRFEQEVDELRKKTRKRIRYSKPLLALAAIIFYPIIIYYGIKNGKRATTIPVGVMLVTHAITSFILITEAVLTYILAMLDIGHENILVVGIIAFLAVLGFASLTKKVGKDLQRAKLETN